MQPARPISQIQKDKEEWNGMHDPAAREALLRRWEPLARHLARSFAWAAEREDLEQVARLALFQAARRYEPARGCRFVSYAYPTILGELRRYVRDRTLPLQVPRRWWELRHRLDREAEAMAQALDREPTVLELAERLGIGEEEVVGSLGIDALRRASSLDATADGGPGEEAQHSARIGAPDPYLEAVELRVVLDEGLVALPTRLREIIRRRYFRGESQEAISRDLGCSQMQISRLERQALAILYSTLRGAWESRVGDETRGNDAEGDRDGRGTGLAAMAADGHATEAAGAGREPAGDGLSPRVASATRRHGSAGDAALPRR
jgi:RNA polymerase sigma-B factor